MDALYPDVMLADLAGGTMVAERSCRILQDLAGGRTATLTVTTVTTVTTTMGRHINSLY